MAIRGKETLHVVMTAALLAMTNSAHWAGFYSSVSSSVRDPTHAAPGGR